MSSIAWISPPQYVCMGFRDGNGNFSIYSPSVSLTEAMVPMVSEFSGFGEQSNINGNGLVPIQCKAI